jgi:hypothetical protein
MNNDVLPTFEAHEVKIETVLSDNGREFCGRPDQHPYELFRNRCLGPTLRLRPLIVPFAPLTRAGGACGV